MASKYQRAVKARARLKSDLAALKALKKHVAGYEGVKLTQKAVAGLTYSQRRSIRQKFEKLRPALDAPHVVVKAKNKQQARGLRLVSRPRVRGMKHFLVPVADPKHSKVVMKGDRVQIERTVGTGKKKRVLRERFFPLPHRPKRPDDVLDMLDDMLPSMPRGYYTVVAAGHGGIGAPIQYENLAREMRAFIAAYNAAPGLKGSRLKYSDVIVGWRWVSNTIKAGDKVVRERDLRREAVRAEHEIQRQLREQDARDEERGRPRRCPAHNLKGRRCVRQAGHAGKHRFRGKA